MVAKKFLGGCARKPPRTCPDRSLQGPSWLSTALAITDLYRISQQSIKILLCRFRLANLLAMLLGKQSSLFAGMKCTSYWEKTFHPELNFTLCKGRAAENVSRPRDKTEKLGSLGKRSEQKIFSIMPFRLA